MFGDDITYVDVLVEEETDDRLHVKILDATLPRYEVPEYAFPRPTIKSPSQNPKYEFTFTKQPFTFQIVRTVDDMVMFNSSSQLVFENQFLEITNIINRTDPNIYGFGEHISPFRLSTEPGMTYTLWAADNLNTVNENLYASHPYYMEMVEGKTHSVFLLNSNGMDVVFDSTNETTTITYRVIGGILDFYFFVGPTPASVNQQYHGLIGFPIMPPYWSLGFHICRYGYKSISEVETVYQNFTNNSLPLDTMWVDINYMYRYRDFTYDPIKWNSTVVKEFVVHTLHKNGLKFVPITDPGISNNTEYQPFLDGLKEDIFIKNADGSIFYGAVWPGTTAFPDFLNPASVQYWQDQLEAFNALVPIDGLWIDMNEISNFCNGQCELHHQPLIPPYAINNFGHHRHLDIQTIDMNCVHYDNYSEYDVHNLYGHLEAIATSTALENLNNNRSFVIGRSTFPGSGSHEGHWLGDNESTFFSLRSSIPGALSMGLFGIPMVGADICGFQLNTNMELCTRWIEVGAFYPFSRDHDTIGVIDQFPYDWPQTMAAFKTSMGARYALLPYYYTLFYRATQSGGAVMQPLLHNFPADSETWGIDEQFMIGEGLLVSPVLYKGNTSVNAYFPRGRWYDWWTGSEDLYEGWTVIDAPLEYVPVHVAGGNILPIRPLNNSLNTVQQDRNNDPYTLVVAVNEAMFAHGELYMDNGEDLNVGHDATHVSYKYHKNYLTTDVHKNDYISHKYFSNVVFYGLKNEPSAVYFNNNNWGSYSWNSTSLVLNVTGLRFGIGLDVTMGIVY